MSGSVLMRGRVVTNDPTCPRAEAVWFESGVIRAVGAWDDLRVHITGARVVDTGGAVILPGWTDGHAHPLSWGRSLSILSLVDSDSVASIVDACVRWGRTNPSGWLDGRGWNDGGWSSSQGCIDRAALDTAFPQRPVWLERADGHAAWVNTAALRAAGLGDRAEDPPGGAFGRHADGTLTGLLVDRAMDVVSAARPPDSDADRHRWLDRARDAALDLGWTGVHDAGVDVDLDRIYRQRAADGRLRLRTYAMASLLEPSGMELVARGPLSESHLYTCRAVKLFADGALGSRGAQLFEPYSDASDTLGLALQSDEELWERASEAARRGFQLAVHAIGDRANARVLDLFARVRREGLPLLRPRVEHAQILRESDVDRLIDLGVIASMQPVHAASDQRMAQARLGRSRLDYAYAWGTLHRRGIPLVFGTDAPVESADGRPSWCAACARAATPDPTSDIWSPADVVPPEVALAAFTSGAAWGAWRESDLGRIRPEYRADLSVFDLDPLTVDPGEWARARTVGVWIDGVPYSTVS